MASALALTQSSNWAKSESTTLAGHRLNSGTRRFFYYGDGRLPSASHQGFLKLRLFIEVMKRGIEIAKSSCTDSPVSHSLLLVSLRHDFLADSIPHAHVQNSRRSVAFVKIFMTALPSLGTTAETARILRSTACSTVRSKDISEHTLRRAAGETRGERSPVSIGTALLSDRDVVDLITSPIGP
jgi:hypothetical protein